MRWSAATQAARRVAVKRALDIIIHLQARLRMDVGGRPAQALSEFYASIFAQILQASQSASKPKFEHAIDCVRNVRDAWRQVARDPEVNPAPASGGPLVCRSDQHLRAMAATRSSVRGMRDAAAHPATVSSSSSCCFW